MANKGLRDYCKYITQDVGNSKVMVNINKTDANMHINIPLYSSKAEIANSIGLLFTLSERNTDYKFGKGISLNYFKELFKSGDYKTKNSDGSITTYTFDRSEGDYIKYYYDRETQTTLVEDLYPGATYKNYLIDKHRNISYYSNTTSLNKYPIKIVSNDGRATDFQYNGSNLFKIIGKENDNTTEEIKFTYANFGGVEKLSLIEIFRESNIINSIVFDYSSNYLNKIIYKNEKGLRIGESEFSFDFTNHIITVIDVISGYRIKYTLDSSNTFITEFIDGYNTTFTKGTKTTLAYNDINTNEDVTIITENNDSLRTYFDDSNYPMYEVDNKGRAVCYLFEVNNRYIKPTLISNSFDNRFLTSSDNLIKNGSFTDLSNWTKVGSGGAVQIISKATNDYTNSFLGGTAVEISSASTTEVSIKQDIAVNYNPQDSLTLIVWGKELVNSDDLTNVAFVRVKCKKNGSEISSLRKELVFKKSNKTIPIWQLQMIEVNQSQEFDKIEVEIVVSRRVKFWFDGVQLYKRPLGQIFSYDNLGNISYSKAGNFSNYNLFNDNSFITQALGSDEVTHSYVYNDMGKVEHQASSYNLSTEYSYDNYGNVSKVKNIINNDFIETNYTHKEATSDSTKYKNTTTDDSGISIASIYNKTLLQLSEVNNPLGEVTKYSYDNYNRLSILEVIKNQTNSKTTNSYNEKHQLKDCIVNTSSGYTYHYDAIGRLDYILVGNTTPATNKLTEYTYDDDSVYSGLIKSIKHGANGDKYIFTYDKNNDDRITSVSLQKPGGNSIEIFKYIYDIYDRLEKIIDLRTIEGASNIATEFKYDHKDRLIKTTNTGLVSDSSEITYNDFDEVNTVLYKDSTKVVFQGFDYLKKSKGMSPEAFIEYYKYQLHSVIGESTSKINYSCFFIEKIKENGTIRTSKKLNVVGKNSDGIVVKKEITPSKGGQLLPAPSYDGLVPSLYQSPNNIYLSYTMGHPSIKSQTVMFWFKTSKSYSETTPNHLFSIGTTYGSQNYLGVWVNSSGRLVLDITDKLGNNYSNLISTSKSYLVGEWNFFSISWELKSSQWTYKLVLNNEYILYISSTIGLNFGDTWEINFGHSRAGSNEHFKFTGSFAALVATTGYAMSSSEVKQFYRLSKEYIFDNSYIDTSQKTVFLENTNLYRFDNYNNSFLSNIDIIPLHNSKVSVKGVKPIITTDRRLMSYDRDKAFNFNKVMKRYAYVADGAKLVYNFNLGNNGSIAVNAIFNEDGKNQYIFQNKDSSGRTLGFLRNSNKWLCVEMDGAIYQTGLSIDNNNWSFLSLSWKILYDNDPELGTVYRFLLMRGSSIVERDIESSFKYTTFKETSIGRRLIERPPVNETDYNVSDALMGQMEMLVYKNSYLDYSGLIDLKSKLVVSG